MSTRTAERTELLTDILTTAVEGGMTGGWCHMEAYRWSAEDPAERGVTIAIAAEGSDSVERDDILSPEVGFGVLELGWPHDPGTEIPVYIVRVTLDTIAHGITVVSEGKAGVASDYVGRVVASSVENEMVSEFDAIDADIVLQAGVFGKVIFG